MLDSERIPEWMEFLVQPPRVQPWPPSNPPSTGSPGLCPIVSNLLFLKRSNYREIYRISE